MKTRALSQPDLRSRRGLQGRRTSFQLPIVHKRGRLSTDADPASAGRETLSTSLDMVSDFPKRLKMACQLRNVEYSQTAIGKSLGLGKQTIDRWMAGTLPRADNIFLIADKWALNPRWLAIGEGEIENYAAAGVRPGSVDELTYTEQELLVGFRKADPRWKLTIQILASLSNEDQVQAATDINMIVAGLVGMKPKDLKYPSDKYVEKKLGLPPNVRRLKNRS